MRIEDRLSMLEDADLDDLLVIVDVATPSPTPQPENGSRLKLISQVYSSAISCNLSASSVCGRGSWASR
jgi:hypothetical protein